MLFAKYPNDLQAGRRNEPIILKHCLGANISHSSGKMLEVYTYHKVKELGRIDDVVSSFEIDWERTEVKSEFDCILTKGFRSLFVECKAHSDIGQEFYFKLASLAEQFSAAGILC